MNYDDQFMKQNQKPPLASPGSLKYLHDLLASRDHEVAVSKLPEVWQDLLNSIAVGNDNVAQKDVSKFIDLLKTCDRKSMSTKAPIPGSAIAANPPTEDGIYAKRTDHRGQPLKDTHFKFYKVYWNRDNNRLLAKEIVLISEAHTNHHPDGTETHHPAVSELQYRGQAYRFVTADDRYSPTLEEAIAFGPRYGRCSQCGRNLNDELSVQLGIGPVCGQRDFGNDFKIMKKMAQAELKTKAGPMSTEDQEANRIYIAGSKSKSKSWEDENIVVDANELRARLAEINDQINKGLARPFERYIQVQKIMKLLKISNFSQAAIIYDANACAFCQQLIDTNQATNTEEVGEFWSETLSDTVLAHPDCLPMGIDDTLAGKDPEWSMA